jgi:polyhydroxyalkanoate synthesis repressor PhaR
MNTPMGARGATSGKETILDTKPEIAAQTAERPRRIIKRYSNRKLYDTKDSRYVTLLQIAEMVRAGEEVQIIDNNTKDDLTEVTLAQIIYEEQKAHSRSVPLQTLKDLIHARTEKVLADLREGPIGRLLPGTRPAEDKPGEVPASRPGEVEMEMKKSDPPKSPSSFVDQAKEKIEDLQHQVDERIKAFLTSFRPLQQLQQEVRRLNERIEELERRLKTPGSGGNAGK